MIPKNQADRVLEDILAAWGLNAGFVVDLYESYRHDPKSVEEQWQVYFQAIERGEPVPDMSIPSTSAPSPTPPPSVVSLPPVETKQSNGGPSPASTPPAATPPPAQEATLVPLRGGSALIVKNMEASREVPTATSYRTMPVKLLEENRRLINEHFKVAGRGKISFTHLIGWAIVQALKTHPRINQSFAVIDDKPHRVEHPSINLGVAVDLEKRDGSRTLLVPNIRAVDQLDFSRFVEAFNLTIQRARTGKLQPEDFQGTTISLSNPGTVGTTSSVPRLMPGQGAIIATGAIDYPAENRAMAQEILSQLGISRRMTISCTYDHRIVQGAESGQFLAEVEALMKGKDDFYDDIFASLNLPYRPVYWMPDYNPGTLAGGGTNFQAIAKQAKVLQLINAYRVRGHLIADLDPLDVKSQYHSELDPDFYDLTMWDRDRTFFTGGLIGDQDGATLREIIETLRATYCGRIGVEYMNIQDPEQKKWLQARMEPTRNQNELPVELRQRLLKKLIGSHGFEKFLHARYVGHKRFSLEGGETLIPILDQLLEEASVAGVNECVMGMSHRGRLNVVTQTVGKSFERIFNEFQGNTDPDATQGSGDVKYHLGAHGVHRGKNGHEISITLSPNPSHLEAVDPVVEGIARARQDQVGGETGRETILPVLIHGDAAFAGQGVVAETLNLSQLHGYRTGGTVHIIVNNQIGFTTPVDSSRSTPYPTDVAKMGQVPIFHVNGDDPEAAVRVVRLAFAFRQEFQKDVVIDMVCYRRHGHNEGDEPSFTQPLMYSKIREHKPIAELYAERLVAEGVVTQEQVDAWRQEVSQILERAAEVGTTQEYGPELVGEVCEIKQDRPTPVNADVLRHITEVLTQDPHTVDVHPKLVRFLQQRKKQADAGEGIDWALAEAWAFGSLAMESHTVRLSGQDSARGTFSQRHLVLHDDNTDTNWIALQNLSPDQAPVIPIDSPLSEIAVLGFEYGYSLADPNGLVLWEAQFGDFGNGAQVLIDQFLAGAETKWGQPSRLTLLLPHGYEGQGPEHSSARLERFLQLCAEDNMQVANLTTPAQYFHALRRQVCQVKMKPLIIMTPKSLLRHPQAVSRLEDFTGGGFQPVLDDPGAQSGIKIKRIVFCSGKVYFDLLKERDKSGLTDVALIRVEELYPFPKAELQSILGRHSGAKLVWAQEEPRNMGAWLYVKDKLETELGITGVAYSGRPESASTATGYHKVHVEEQKALVDHALKA